MSSEPFNTLGGLTVGIPAIPVVNSTGTVVANVNNDYVLANTVLTNNLRYANGNTYVPGANTQLVFNSNYSFGASANLTFDTVTNFLTTTNLNVLGATSLGDVANVSITGGLNGYFLQTDGLGTLTWTAGTGGGGGNGEPGGSNTQVQFNNAGTFAGDPSFTFDYLSNVLTAYQVNASNFVGNLVGTASNAITSLTVTNSSQPNIISVGTLVNLTSSGPVVAQSFSGDGGNLSNIPAANLNGPVPNAMQVTDNAQPNITSVGNLVSLTVIGTVTAGNLNSANRLGGGNLFVTGNASIGGNVSITTGNVVANGNVAFSGGNITLGIVSNVHIAGGFNGQVLSTDGLGNLSWVNQGGGNGGGNSLPGGANGAVQFNNGGIFGGSPYFTFNSPTQTVNISGNLIANTLTIGSGVYEFSTSSVYFATTTSVTANQMIYSVLASTLSAIDFTIVATNDTIQARETSKIAATIYNGMVAFNEYAGLQINGGVGSYSVIYDAGNVVNPPTLQLLVSPLSAGLTNYKMQITRLAEY